MFTNLEVRNFQSLKEVDLVLGKFTLVTGESHSGKSAVMRAIQAAASNMYGTRDIKQGEQDMSVTLVSDTHKVTLHRTVKGRDDYYKIVDLATGEEQKFGTLGVSGIPEEVTQVLRMDPVSKTNPSVNFHVQHDLPYLVTQTGSFVARELGELTKVNAILAGVREASRRLKAKNAELKSKQTDLANAVVAVRDFKDLPTKDAALTRAEQSLARARGLQQRIEVLQSSVKVLERADTILGRNVPSAQGLTDRWGVVRQVSRALEMVEYADRAYKAAAVRLEQEQASVSELREQHHNLLVELGTCPTCGSTVT